MPSCVRSSARANRSAIHERKLGLDSSAYSDLSKIHRLPLRHRSAVLSLLTTSGDSRSSSVPLQQPHNRRQSCLSIDLRSPDLPPINSTRRLHNSKTQPPPQCFETAEAYNPAPGELPICGNAISLARHSVLTQASVSTACGPSTDEHASCELASQPRSCIVSGSFWTYSRYFLQTRTP